MDSRGLRSLALPLKGDKGRRSVCPGLLIGEAAQANRKTADKQGVGVSATGNKDLVPIWSFKPLRPWILSLLSWAAADEGGKASRIPFVSKEMALTFEYSLQLMCLHRFRA